MQHSAVSKSGHSLGQNWNNREHFTIRIWDCKHRRLENKDSLLHQFNHWFMCCTMGSDDVLFCTSRSASWRLHDSAILSASPTWCGWGWDSRTNTTRGYPSREARTKHRDKDQGIQDHAEHSSKFTSRQQAIPTHQQHVEQSSNKVHCGIVGVSCPAYTHL